MTTNNHDGNILNALEFYAGIGGLHRALTYSSLHARLVVAYDWDPAARQVYDHNYPKGIFKRADISQLQSADLIPLHAQLWLSSPSCQPYTVLNPTAQGEADPRAASFLHLITVVLPALAATQEHPEYILIENVAGFETSTTRQTVLAILRYLQYHVIELLLTPLQFGIPNSRLRYYLLARLHRSFSHTPPSPSADSRVWRHIPAPGAVSWVDERNGGGVTLEAYLDELTEEEEIEYGIPDRVLEKWGRLFDIVLPTSTRTCCFIRGYTHLAERAGSILQMNAELDTTETFNKYAAFISQIPSPPSAEALSILRPLRLRYFTPTELLRIFHFNPPCATPPSAPLVPPAPGTGSPGGESGVDTVKVNKAFEWPSSTTRKTRYRLVGNSVNVEVVAQLLRYLVLDYSLLPP